MNRLPCHKWNKSWPVDVLSLINDYKAHMEQVDKVAESSLHCMIPFVSQLTWDFDEDEEKMRDRAWTMAQDHVWPDISNVTDIKSQMVLLTDLSYLVDTWVNTYLEDLFTDAYNRFPPAVTADRMVYNWNYDEFVDAANAGLTYHCVDLVFDVGNIPAEVAFHNVRAVRISYVQAVIERIKSMAVYHRQKRSETVVAEPSWSLSDGTDEDE